jgi:hypothetical protein
MVEPYYKIVMLGEGKIISLIKLLGRVGKTSLTLRYCSNVFDEN